MIYIGSFLKIDRGSEGMLMFCLRNFRGCNVGIVDGKDL
jgi:hypothetical protein